MTRYSAFTLDELRDLHSALQRVIDGEDEETQSFEHLLKEIEEELHRRGS